MGRFYGAAGSLGFIEVTGARLRQREALGGGSPDVLAYFVHQLAKVLEGEVSIVLWGQLDDEDADDGARVEEPHHA